MGWGGARSGVSLGVSEVAAGPPSFLSSALLRDGRESSQPETACQAHRSGFCSVCVRQHFPGGKTPE